MPREVAASPTSLMVPLMSEEEEEEHPVVSSSARAAREEREVSGSRREGGRQGMEGRRVRRRGDLRARRAEGRERERPSLETSTVVEEEERREEWAEATSSLLRSPESRSTILAIRPTTGGQGQPREVSHDQSAKLVF